MHPTKSFVIFPNKVPDNLNLTQHVSIKAKEDITVLVYDLNLDVK